MRVKLSNAALSVRGTTLMIWGRITLSRLTIIYFLFSLVHCIIQVLFQAQAFEINASAASLVNSILVTANATSPGFAILDDTLKWCKGLPNENLDNCRVVWSPSSSGIHAAQQASNASDTSSSLYPSSTTETVSSSLASPASTIQVVDTSAPSAVPTLINTPVVESQSGSRLTTTVTRFVVATPSPTSDISQPERRAALSQPPRAWYPGVGSSSKRNIVISAMNNSILLSGLPNAPSELVLNTDCLLALNWPLETLENTKREDIVFINFHVWVLGMSVVALLNESIPHMLASLVTHVMVTAWAAFQLVQTHAFQRDFSRIITHGACQGENLLPTYWRDRGNAEIPSCALNGAALIVSLVLTYKLFKTYSWATFKRIGASRNISRVYKLVLSFSVTLQLSLFFIVVSVALWIDQLCNGVIGQFAAHMMLYKGIYITVLLLLVPWIIAGWKAVRIEHRLLMHIFLFFNVILIGGWASMFASVVFRYTFLQWRFFSIMSITALLCSVGLLVLGITCRMNFGSDLKKYLGAQERIEDDEFISAIPQDFKEPAYEEKDEVEKISFPSMGSLPIFSNASSLTSLSRNTSSEVKPRGGEEASPASTNFSPVIYMPALSRFSDADAMSLDGRRISVGSAHSASSIDAVPTMFSKSAGAGEAGKKIGSRSKRWIIE